MDSTSSQGVEIEGSRLAQISTLDHLLNETARLAIEAVSAESGYLVLSTEREGLQVRVRRTRTGEEIEGQDLQISRKMIKEALEQKRTVLSSAAQPVKKSTGTLARPAPVLCSPLVSRDRAIGVVYIEGLFTAQPFSDSDVRSIEKVTGPAALAIENFLLAEQNMLLEKRNRQLEAENAENLKAKEALQKANEQVFTLRMVDNELGSMLDVEYVLDLAIDASLRLSMADAVMIALNEDDVIRVVQAVGPYEIDIHGVELSPDVGITGRVIRSRQAEYVRDTGSDPDYQEVISTTQAQITVPLYSHKRFIGILSLETSHPEVFSDATFESLTLLATRISVALDNARMYEETWRLAIELDAFSHTVAHDLKTPLNSVLGYAELITDRAGSLTQEQIDQYLQSIRRSARKMVSIIDSLLLLASIREIDEVTVAQLDMAAVVKDVRERFAFMIDSYNAEVIIPEQWPSALGYAPWVEEIWANYVSNAMKYGGSPPRVEVGAEPGPDGMVSFWVQDNGAGLTHEEQAQLFTTFTRLGHVQVDGHGLGLSIVQRIAEKLGGWVAVESVKGQGSKFIFALPVPE